MSDRSAREEIPQDLPSVEQSTRISSFRIHDPHWVEHEVQHVLLSHPHLNFSTLVVRRLVDGVCLEGVLEADTDAPDVCGLARQVAGVEQVLNHLVVRQPRRPPAKG